MIKAELVIHPKAFITTFRARSFGEILEQARDAPKKFFKKNKKKPCSNIDCVQVHTLCIPQ